MKTIKTKTSKQKKILAVILFVILICSVGAVFAQLSSWKGPSPSALSGKPTAPSGKDNTITVKDGDKEIKIPVTQQQYDKFTSKCNDEYIYSYDVDTKRFVTINLPDYTYTLTNTGWNQYDEDEHVSTRTYRDGIEVTTDHTSDKTYLKKEDNEHFIPTDVYNQYNPMIESVDSEGITLKEGGSITVEDGNFPLITISKEDPETKKMVTEQIYDIPNSPDDVFVKPDGTVTYKGVEYDEYVIVGATGKATLFSTKDRKTYTKVGVDAEGTLTEENYVNNKITTKTETNPRGSWTDSYYDDGGFYKSYSYYPSGVVQEKNMAEDGFYYRYDEKGNMIAVGETDENGFKISGTEATFTKDYGVKDGSLAAKEEAQDWQNWNAVLAGEPGYTYIPFIGAFYTGGKVSKTVSDALDLYKSKTAISSAMFGHASWFNEWREKMDTGFLKYLDIKEYWPSEVCAKEYKISGGGTLSIETPTGQVQFIAHVEAERSKKLPDDTYFYKITYGVTAPHDEKLTPNKDESGAISFNIEIKNNIKKWVFVEEGTQIPHYIELKNGESKSATGEDAIVFYSANKYDEICIIFDKKPRDKDDNKINNCCNTITESDAGKSNWEQAHEQGAEETPEISGEVNQEL